MLLLCCLVEMEFTLSDSHTYVSGKCYNIQKSMVLTATEFINEGLNMLNNF